MWTKVLKSEHSAVDIYLGILTGAAQLSNSWCTKVDQRINRHILPVQVQKEGYGTLHMGKRDHVSEIGPRTPMWTKFQESGPKSSH